MKAIRGATTVQNDTPEDIKEGVKQLLTAIKDGNSLTTESIICIMFSSTSDLCSYYPAKAAREAGFFSCALYSSLEPEINGSLKKCIRVMVLAEISGEPKHIYLKGATNLRKDLIKKINIAIDGPAGSGKSTISKIVAARFNILHLDTGATYRAVALACIRAGADLKSEEQVGRVLQSSRISVKYENGAQITVLDGEDVSDVIRSPEVSLAASAVSAYGCVREKMVQLQREVAAESSCVLDGRDIGTNVLPDAQFKFFLTASAEVRAERRTKENLSKGFNQSYKSVLEEIILRDEQDKTRKISPLVKADDAVEVDTSLMTIDEVADTIIKAIQEKI